MTPPGPGVVIGHRGASGYRPEHTAASYALASAMGADLLDVDLVSTADRVLVVRHDDDLTATTDVADHPELAGLRRTHDLHGAQVTGWFAQDLTLAQVRTLRAVERLEDLRPDNRAWNGQPVMAFAEVVALALRLGAERGRPVGLCPELKHPTASAARGLALEPLLLADLEATGALDSGTLADGAPLVVQSFEPSCLTRLHDLAPPLRLLQLVDAAGSPEDADGGGEDGGTFADLLTPAGLARTAEVATVLAPHKDLVLGDGDDRGAALVDAAAAAGMAVWTWTSRSENAFLAPELRTGTDPRVHGRVLEEQRRLWAAGVDGIFTDQPDTAVESRRRAQRGAAPPQG